MPPFKMTVSRTICAGFLVLIVLGSGLLWLPIATASGHWNDPIVAIFTATSAVCVTGLIVVDTGSYFSPLGQGIILLLIQVGGLGYMTATTFLLLLLGRRLGLRDRLAIQKSMDTQELSGAKSLIISIISLTLVFELTGIFALIPQFSQDFGWVQGIWLAIFHSISAFNNAGFSLFSNSLVAYVQSPGVNGTIMALVILGGIGYQVIMEAFLWLRDRLQGQRKYRCLSLHFKIVTTTTLFLLVLGTVVLFYAEFTNPTTLSPLSWNHKFLAAAFQSVIARTAGFNSIDIGAMHNASQFFMAALMFIGGSPGSTAGGIKTTTAAVLLICTRTSLQGKHEVLVYQREIPAHRILKAISVVVGSGGLVLGVTLLIALFDPEFSFLPILFESVSAFATVGLSTGITTKLSTASQLLLIGTMYVGRVGVVLFIAALVGDHNPSLINYPEEDLLVG